MLKIPVLNFTCLCLLLIRQCNSNFKYQTSKISNEQCNICRSWSKPASNAMARVNPCSFTYKLVYKIKFDAPVRGHHIYKEIWTSQKDDILYCKKNYHSERLDIDKYIAGIYKQDRLVGHGFMTGDPPDCMSRGNLSWPRRNIFTKGNVMKVSNLFVVSNGRVNNFMHHNGFLLCCKTTAAQRDPEWLTDKLILYILHAHRLSIKYKKLPSSIIVMDETSVWNEIMSNTAIDKQGAKSVCLKTTGHDKCMVSICLAVKADGNKLKPFIVFCAAKRESISLDEEFKSCCVVKSSGNTWMNEQLTTIWEKQVLGAFLGLL